LFTVSRHLLSRFDFPPGSHCVDKVAVCKIAIFFSPSILYVPVLSGRLEAPTSFAPLSLGQSQQYLSFSSLVVEALFFLLISSPPASVLSMFLYSSQQFRIDPA